MNVFKQISLKDYGPFSDTKFAINPGLSVVYGLNKSGGRYSTNANGSGKSFLLSSLSEILFESPTIGEKQDVIKTGVRSLSITIGGKDVVIRRNKSLIEIKVDNKLKKFRTATIARAFIKKLIPFSEEEYQTYIYLDSRSPHPLVMGNSMDRKRFFTSFFGLDKMDIEKKLLQAELSNLAKSKSAFEELYADYKKSTVELIDRKTNDELIAKAKKGQSILVGLQEKSLAIQEVERLVKFRDSNQEMLAKLSIALQYDYTMESYDLCLADTKWALKHNSESLEACILWEQYKRDNKAYIEAYRSLSKLAKKLLDTSVSKAKIGSDRYLKAMQKFKVLNLDLDAIGELGVKPTKVIKPDSNELDLLVLKKTYMNQINHSAKFSDSKCETCGQLVTIKNPKVVKRRLSETIKSLESWISYKEYVVDSKEYIVNSKKLVEINAELELLHVDIAKYKPYFLANKELIALPDEPEEFEGRKSDIVIVQRMVEEDKERMQLLSFVRPHMDTVIALSKLTEAQTDEIAEVEAIRARINRIQDTVAGINAKISLQAVLRSKAKVTKTRLAELKLKLADEEPLKVALGAYSDKGMKRNAIQSISNTLMKTVNLYAKTVFAEDYQFEFRWDTSQLSLLVHRTFKGKVHTSDVRKLSGAESKLFTLILVFALLTFVPAYKRSNLLVLDEPTANMSEETTESFKKLLPVLIKVIPSIIVITPKTNERYEDAHNFTVIKDDGVSTVHKGHPSELKKAT